MIPAVTRKRPMDKAIMTFETLNAVVDNPASTSNHHGARFRYASKPTQLTKQPIRKSEACGVTKRNWSTYKGTAKSDMLAAAAARRDADK